MVNVNCPICTIDKSREIFSVGDLDRPLRNVICETCGLVYINPRPSENEYLEYQGSSGKGSGHHGRNTLSAVEEKVLDGDSTIKKKVAEYLAPYVRESSRVLDVGCGFGTLLNTVAKKTGAKCEGVELNEHDAILARKLFGLDIFFGSLEQFYNQSENSKRYDLIILHHTLEHLPNPIAELERIRVLLKEDGLLYIAVPNVLNIKKRPEIFFQLGHAYSFSPYSLRRLLQKAGFKIIAFNRHAAFPGGMELIAAHNGDSRPELPERNFSEGKNYEEVIHYVENMQKRYALFRRIRDASLFWLPKSLRIRISHRVYRALKKLW